MSIFNRLLDKHKDEIEDIAEEAKADGEEGIEYVVNVIKNPNGSFQFQGDKALTKAQLLHRVVESLKQVL